jgi:hypothetical protein
VTSNRFAFGTGERHCSGAGGKQSQRCGLPFLAVSVSPLSSRTEADCQSALRRVGYGVAAVVGGRR